MPPTAFIIAPLLLALVLLTASVGKLRAPERARDAFVDLAVPRALRQRWVRTAHPWGEVVLGVGLVVASGWLGRVVAFGSVVLTLTYLWLVLRAVRQPENVDCDCFGSLASGVVTWTTVVRNVIYVGLAATALWLQVENAAVPTLFGAFASRDSWWLGGAALALLTAALTVGGSSPPNAASDAGASDEELEEYERRRTPAVPVTLADGTVSTLRELSRERAQLVFLVSETCGFCEEVADQVPRWRKDLPLIDLRLLVPTTPELTTMPAAKADPMTLHDPQQWVRESLGVSGSPAAVLFGVDGQLAGGPVGGTFSIDRFIDDIRNELRAAAAEDR